MCHSTCLILVDGTPLPESKTTICFEPATRSGKRLTLPSLGRRRLGLVWQPKSTYGPSVRILPIGENTPPTIPYLRATYHLLNMALAAKQKCSRSEELFGFSKTIIGAGKKSDSTSTGDPTKWPLSRLGDEVSVYNRPAGTREIPPVAPAPSCRSIPDKICFQE